ncbi:unnamed protein product [Rotaria sordida]|uniref:Calpain catalytic domain-containing protein n=1 Tax=Rotaria sordida TaxID=392033 RepID=A0A819ITF5_9BILA|nr:unnamed protein product [Rotaria sordida]
MPCDSDDIYSSFLPLNNYQWSCPKCFFDNPSTNYSTYEICNYTNPNVNEDLFVFDSIELNWKCPWCQLKNQANNAFCESCCQIKPALEYNESDFLNRTLTKLTPRSITIRDHPDQFEVNSEIKFQEMISFCKEAKINFVDDQFIPSNHSLGSNSFSNVVQWLRISDTFPLSDKHSWTVFSSPEPSDIEQGALGNCWLMAALALITERPRILEHILLTQTINNEGIYFVRICYNGLWKTIIIDDYFPCTNQKHLVFSRARRYQLFVPLIEKACAKLFGSYNNLINGSILEGLQLLTGTPCDYIDLQLSDEKLDNDIIWAKLVSAYESNLLIGASTGRKDMNEREYSLVGIPNNHAFSILAAYTFSDYSSRFVLVRDPHARSNYIDKYVTSIILDRLRLINDTSHSSGAFWISWSIFLRYFSTITISNYNEDHFDIRHEGKFTCSSIQHVPCYHFHISETSLINISLIYHRHDRKIHPYHTQSFVLCDIDTESSFDNIGKYENILKSRQGGFTYWTGSLRPGNYILIPFSIGFWGQDTKNNDYTLVIHSSIPIDLTIALEPPILLADCLISAVIKKYHISTKKEDMTYYITPKEIALMLLIVENRSTNYHLNFDTNIITQSKNLQHSRFSWNTHDCIPSHHRQLIFITEWTSKPHSMNNYTYNLTYKHNTHTTDATPEVNSYLDDLHTPRLF